MQNSEQVALPGQQDMTFNNQYGEKLKGSLVDSPSNKVAVLCHGFASSRNGFQLPKLAEALQVKGFGSFRFDFSGNGESEGEFQFGNYYKEAEDLRSAVTLMRELGKEVVAVLGHSKGGDVVLIYAAQYDDVPRVINVAGRFDMKRGITQRFGDGIFKQLNEELSIPQETPRDSGPTIQWNLTQQSMEQRLSLNMGEVCSRISSSEVLTVHGTADRVIPVEDAQSIAKSVPSHSLFIVEGASHRFSNEEHAAQMIKKVVEFIYG